MGNNDRYQTEQEVFWAGEFGDDYINRNKSDFLLASNINFFSQSLRRADGIGSCIEFGANIGMNIKALKLLRPSLDAFGVEINSKAAIGLKEVIPENNIFNTSILEFNSTERWDLVLIKGVLIHLNPKYLDVVYDKLLTAAKRYILIAEYYNPNPVTIPYRGHADKLFKRDFAGELMDKSRNVKLIDYGFCYHRDVNYPQDDITWFLLEKY